MHWGWGVDPGILDPVPVRYAARQRLLCSGRTVVRPENWTLRVRAGHSGVQGSGFADPSRAMKMVVTLQPHHNSGENAIPN